MIGRGREWEAVTAGDRELLMKDERARGDGE